MTVINKKIKFMVTINSLGIGVALNYLPNSRSPLIYRPNFKEKW